MKPLCRHFRKCSGCTNLQTPYPKQIRDKTIKIQKSLASCADNHATVFEETAPSPDQFGYRTSTKLCLDEDNFGLRRIGLYQHESKTVIDIPDCPVHHPAINSLVHRLFHGKIAAPAPFYQHAKRSFQRERLKFLTARVSPTTKAAAIIVSHTGVDQDALQAWATTIASQQLSIYGCELTKADDTRIISSHIRHLAGPKTVPFTIGERQFSLSPFAFFQANSSLTPAFIQHIAGNLKGGTLLDLYGGFGAYSFEAAPRFETIHLVDGNEDAITAATSQPTKPHHLHPIVSSVEEFLTNNPRLLKDRVKVTHIIVNPPRAGLSAKVSALLAKAAQMPQLRELVYVSCNPETLARDIKVLVKSQRWRLATVKGFDMFPQTGHIEVVAKLIIK
jgi:23S rRNA (uracil-5-)-methyltransferase RumA